MRLGLTARILIGGGVIAGILLVQFFVTIGSFRSIRDNTRLEQRASASVVAAIRVENSVLGLETGFRGYVLTSDPRFLQPYDRALRTLPGESRRLMKLVPGAWPKELDRQWRSYVSDWSTPLIDLAGRSPRLARLKIATGEGRRRVDRMRALIDPFVHRSSIAVALERQRVSKAVSSGLEVGVLGT
ncbi:MAG TPA: CHASE3 domain-containing protein, partial [Gaiellaceae bacterium]|nr:CHASE3 domain-containing protein [Gaiellaceae bacterium]